MLRPISCKALIAVLVLSFFSGSVVSQIVYSSKPSSTFFFTIGLTSSHLINDTNSYKSGILFNGGFIYSVNVTDKINIALECLYTGKGLKQDSPIIKYRYYYIDVPLYLQLKLSESFRFNIGMQYSTFSNSQIVLLDPSKKNGVNVEKHTAIKNTDYGFLLGTEIDITKNFAIAARYTISGSTFFEKAQVNFGVFQLSFNYTAFRTYKQFFHKKEKQQNEILKPEKK
ncbi:MAG: outer membrane beta-barrel protein [Bacteroidota bacterium]